MVKQRSSSLLVSSFLTPRCDTLLYLIAFLSIFSLVLHHISLSAAADSHFEGFDADEEVELDDDSLLLQSSFSDVSPSSLSSPSSVFVTRAHLLKNPNEKSSSTSKISLFPLSYGGYSVSLNFGSPPKKLSRQMCWKMIKDEACGFVWNSKISTEASMVSTLKASLSLSSPSPRDPRAFLTGLTMLRRVYGLQSSTFVSFGQNRAAAASIPTITDQSLVLLKARIFGNGVCICNR
ncbi:hypothetical protein L2E82_08652 [Cichorium intybus]|uniref:Uncharacterized protein n=1 Tax=Cichorium intybus TaxID=13427 RepID=A0ACB9G7T4_CICIN|nr:hypothetical protein L2E82_08652 [Cichorium intybus]